MPDATIPEVGKTYKVNHRRKGVFTAKVIAVSGEWADVCITDGRAEAMLPENEGEVGDTLTVRIGFCTFTEVTK